MPHINLLPWRDTLKKEREIRFGVAAGVALALAGLIALGVHLYMEGEISYQQKRNNFIKAEIKKVEEDIKEIERLQEKKQRLIDRMNVIQRLEANRPKIVHLFDELVKRVPDGVYFTSMKQEGAKVTLEGVAQSDARVSSLMNEIDRSEWMKDPNIIEIRRKEKKDDRNNARKTTRVRTVSNFILEFHQASPKSEEEEEENK